MPDNQIQMLEGLSHCGCSTPRSRYSERLAGLGDADASGRGRTVILVALALGGVGYLGARHMERRRDAADSRERAVTRFLADTERIGREGRQRSSRTRRGR